MKTFKFEEDKETKHIEWKVLLNTEAVGFLYKLMCGKIKFDLLVEKVREILNSSRGSEGRKIDTSDGTVSLLLPCEERIRDNIYVLQFSVITDELFPYLRVKEIDEGYRLGNDICFWLGTLINNADGADYIHTVTYEMVKDLAFFKKPIKFDFKEANVTVTIMQG